MPSLLGQHLKKEVGNDSAVPLFGEVTVESQMGTTVQEWQQIGEGDAPGRQFLLQVFQYEVAVLEKLWERACSHLHSSSPSYPSPHSGAPHSYTNRYTHGCTTTDSYRHPYSGAPHSYTNTDRYAHGYSYAHTHVSSKHSIRDS